MWQDSWCKLAPLNLLHQSILRRLPNLSVIRSPLDVHVRGPVFNHCWGPRTSIHTLYKTFMESWGNRPSYHITIHKTNIEGSRNSIRNLELVAYNGEAAVVCPVLATAKFKRWFRICGRSLISKCGEIRDSYITLPCIWSLERLYLPSVEHVLQTTCIHQWLFSQDALWFILRFAEINLMYERVRTSCTGGVRGVGENGDEFPH